MSFFGKEKYFPQRDVSKEPITIEDVMGVNALPANSAGSEYLKKHLRYINTNVSHEFVNELAIQMMQFTPVILDKYKTKTKLSAEEMCIWLAHGYCFAMTEVLFDIARKDLISGACRDAIKEMTMMSQMELSGEGAIVLHCLYKGFEISRFNVPVEND